jgi:benzoyl-CoA reductase subunit C
MKDMIEDIIKLSQNKFEMLKESNKPKIGWISISTPEEIIHAADMIPFRITGELGEHATDAGALLSNNYCSYVLSCLSEGLDGLYDFVDGIVFVDACDMRKRLYETWTRNLPLDYSFFLELPKEINPLSREYYRMQLRRLIESIEKQYRCKITESSLQEAIHLSNQTRRLLQRLYQFRKLESPPITGDDSIHIVKSSMCGFKSDFNGKLEQLLSTLDSEGESDGFKPYRVLLCGSYFDNRDIIHTIESCGACLVCEDNSNGIKYFEGQIDPDSDPINAIADYYLEKCTCARIVDTDRRLNHLFKLIDEYRVDAVIYFSLKFCDTNLMDYPYIRSELVQKGIPVLHIEGEQHIENIENIKTRIQTFLETSMY